ncbi:MAG: chemotaxis protein CheB [Gammaproteobacteria bacterium]
MSVNQTNTRVAIMATSPHSQDHLSDLLGDAGLDVVMHETAGDEFLQQLEKVPADVLLVDLCDDTDSEVEVIQTLLDYDSLPVLFNDSSKGGGETNSAWAKKLAYKLKKMAESFEPDPETEIVLEPESVEIDNFESEINAQGPGESETDVEPAEAVNLAVTVPKTNVEKEFDDSVVEASPKNDAANVAGLTALKKEPSFTNLPEGAAKNVWVLGASLGGPQAVRQFVTTIKKDLPVAFILAQHIGANHMSLLAEQLNRVTSFKVFTGYSGHMIRHNEIILAPAGMQIKITDDGYIALKDEPPDTLYSPCINDVIEAVARRYGNMSGAIVFSGMGDDGAIGCRSMAEHGGIVWAQDMDSCVISSMPDQARKTNNVTFSADPRKLADELYAYYDE